LLAQKTEHHAHSVSNLVPLFSRARTKGTVDVNFQVPKRKGVMAGDAIAATRVLGSFAALAGDSFRVAN
jgi:hypothetical protein